MQALQALLDEDPATEVAASGPGSSGNESMYFGSLTQVALAKWQSLHGITPASGYFGPLTRATIAGMCGKVPQIVSQGTSAPATAPAPQSSSPYLQLGSSGSDVSTLQTELQKLGYFPSGLAPTGYFGPLTQSWLEAFQAANKLPQSGEYDLATQAVLNDLFR